MTVAVIALVSGLVILTLGAESLIKGGSSLARHLGLTPLVIGLTVVAFGTSTPELIVSVGGAWKAQGNMALGNVVGSNIFNVGVILGLAAMVAPIRVKLGLIRIDAPIMIAVTLLALWFAYQEWITRTSGLVLFGLLVLYTVFSIRLAKKESSLELQEEFNAAIPSATSGFKGDLVFVVAGLGLLMLGSRFFVDGALSIGRSLGISDAILGLTVVAAGTSMPELATSLVAAIRGQSDMAIGNVIGSNIFNILGILGLAATVKPIHAPGISAFDLWVMLAFAVALLLLIWTGRKVQRWEGGLLFLGYLAYLWFLWPS